MESSNGSSLKNFSFSNKQLIMDSNSEGSGSSHHHRCNSESFLIEEQPSWLDDLLNEPAETLVVHKGHRRSASDTFAYIGAAAERLNTRENNNNVNVGGSSINYVSYKDHFTSVSFDTKPTFAKAALELNEKHNREVTSTQNKEGSSERSNNTQAKHSMSKADAKRAKQQSAHRSRVRKLQHIAELERTVQALQAEGSELSAELEFLDQQNIILSMENRALRQRLDSLSQEQLIKHLEQEMLERELTRLQTLYQMQRQQVQQQQHQQPQQQNHSKHRRNKSRDLEAQFANLSIKNNEASSSRVQVTGSVRM
ncbi:uncharacterized protein At4g06598-like isoform X1 [Nicotiana tabacum]|uniref:Uncharacterized protein At4g06598-like isoform X1 n=1 Tax=Nicotiana tabacum TaxID=4097 RepID=A0A1S4BIF2_TOBAC|nr:PREDICTED: uncharacterized protein At4g06598-like isoform X1 [Nicotiana tabacum]